MERSNDRPLTRPGQISLRQPSAESLQVMVGNLVGLAQTAGDRIQASLWGAPWKANTHLRKLTFDFAHGTS